MTRTVAQPQIASPHATARRRQTPHHERAPRAQPHRRLRVAARQGRPGGSRLPRGRERLHRGADRPPGRAAPVDLRRDQGAHVGDRPVRADPQPRALVLRPVLRGHGSTAPAAGSRSPTPTTGLPHGWPRTPLRTSPRCPGEELLLDLNQLAEGHEFFSLGGSSITIDGNLLAYAIDVVGDERYDVRVKDLRTGELLPDEVTGTLGGVTWHPSGDDFYYTTVDDSWRADKIWRHRLGTAQADDELVFHETDGRFWVGCGRTRSERFLMIATGSKTTAEYHYLDTTDPDADWEMFAERREDVEYSLDHAVIGGEECFLVLHNASGPDFELGRAPIAPTPPEQWQPLIAHDPAVRLEDVDAFAGHLVVHQRSQGLTQVRILELGGARGDRRLPGRVRPGDLHGRIRWQPELPPADRPGRLHEHGRAVVGLRLRRPSPRADPAQAGTGAGRLRPGRLRGAPALGHRGRR